MKNISVNQVVKEKYKDYLKFIASPKSVKGPIRISKQKGNHHGSYLFTGDLYFDSTFIKCAILNIEVNFTSNVGFSASIMSDDIQGKQLFRMDTKGGVHYNLIDENSSAYEKVVTLPHFHHFSKSGHFLAYQTNLLKDEGVKDDIQKGLSLFFAEANIQDAETLGKPNVILPSECKVYDPCCNVDFDDSK